MHWPVFYISLYCAFLFLDKGGGGVNLYLLTEKYLSKL